jgi:hypothetical protein
VDAPGHDQDRHPAQPPGHERPGVARHPWHRHAGHLGGRDPDGPLDLIGQAAEARPEDERDRRPLRQPGRERLGRRGNRWTGHDVVAGFSASSISMTGMSSRIGYR